MDKPRTPQLIVINGPIASGKSTVARRSAGIAERAGLRSAVIDLDEIWLMLDHQRRPTGRIEKWLLARRAAAALTDLFFQDGIGLVICEGPFFTCEERHGYLRHLRTEVNAHFVTLSVSYEESLKRSLGDPHPDRVASKDQAWLRTRYEESSRLLEYLRSSDVIVETNGRTPDETAREIAERLSLLGSAP